MFGMGLKARRSGSLEDFDELYHQQSDVCMLRMFESFLESAPQLVLQLYIMLSDREYSTWTGGWTRLLTTLDNHLTRLMLKVSGFFLFFYFILL